MAGLQSSEQKFEIKNFESDPNIENPRFILKGPPQIPVEAKTEAISSYIRNFDLESDTEEILPPAPNDSVYLEILCDNATVLFSHGDSLNAIAVLEEAINRQPDYGRALELLLDCSKASKSSRHQAAALQALIRFHFKPEYLFDLANLKIESNPEEGRSLLLEFLEFPDLESWLVFEANKSLGNLALRSGDIEGAEEFYNRAFSINPASDVLLVNFGTLEIQRGRLERARDRFLEALEINPLNEKGWIGLSLLSRELGDIELAWGHLKKALDINPENLVGRELFKQWSSAE